MFNHAIEIPDISGNARSASMGPSLSNDPGLAAHKARLNKLHEAHNLAMQASPVPGAVPLTSGLSAATRKSPPVAVSAVPVAPEKTAPAARAKPPTAAIVSTQQTREATEAQEEAEFKELVAGAVASLHVPPGRAEAEAKAKNPAINTNQTQPSDNAPENVSEAEFDSLIAGAVEGINKTRSSQATPYPTRRY